jgi:glycosyltransferase involved in cell wall biosynthesis
MNTRQRILIFVVCYNAESFIESVLDRIPAAVWEHDDYQAEVLIIDDESADQTFYRAVDYTHRHRNLTITVLHNPTNQGYGGNQKIGYHYAVEHGFDAVVLMHGDGQYSPECLGEMIQPIVEDEADVVLGSRMLYKWDALKGKMPLYKWVGNQILTSLQNMLLGTRLAEFHTGYRAYRVEALAAVPFRYNSNYFDFDTDILIQMIATNQRIKEIPIPTFYGEEVSRVNGFRYGALILWACFVSRVMRFGILYHPKFDYDQGNMGDTGNTTGDTGNTIIYKDKFGFPSSHQFAFERVPPNSTVLDIGCGPGFAARELSKKGCSLISLDKEIHPIAQQYSIKTVEADVETFDFAEEPHHIDTILILDSIGHVRRPELLLHTLRERYSQDDPMVIITAANVAFITMRIGLLLGQFNYGKSGILDLNHTRLFTYSSLRRVLLENGYDIIEEQGIPAPFPLAFGDGPLARLLLAVNQGLIRLSRRLFSYHVAFVAKPKPTLSHLLQNARESSEQKQQHHHYDSSPDC